MNKPNAIIVDIDGTLSDSSHRQHYMEQEHKDWDSFYKELVYDQPNKWCVEIINKFKFDTVIILLTGRPNKYQHETEEWLERFNIDYGYLYMRHDGDFRSDFIIKKEIYMKNIADKFNVIFALDDRKQVVDMWRGEGIPTLQCSEGNF